MQNISQKILPLPNAFLPALEQRLENAKFTIWRNVTWNANCELPLFAFKEVYFPIMQSQSVFLKEAHAISAQDLKDFASDCLDYVQRTRSTRVTRTKWWNQFVVICCVVGDNISDEAMTLVKKGTLSHSLSCEMLFPVLLDRQSRRVTYYDKAHLYGLFIYFIAQKLVQKYILQALKDA